MQVHSQISLVRLTFSSQEALVTTSDSGKLIVAQLRAAGQTTRLFIRKCMAKFLQSDLLLAVRKYLCHTSDSGKACVPPFTEFESGALWQIPSQVHILYCDMEWID